jgi:hypothetical protein
MATIADTFDAASARAGTTVLTVVSNQGDAIASYTHGDLRYVRSPSRVVPGQPPMFRRNHLESSDDAQVLFSDRVLTLPGSDPNGFGPQQPFDVEAPNTARIALAPSGNGGSHSASWDVNLHLPAPFNRTYAFTANVVGSTLVGTTPAIGMSELSDHATHVLSMKFIDAPR